MKHPFLSPPPSLKIPSPPPLPLAGCPLAGPCEPFCLQRGRVGTGETVQDMAGSQRWHILELVTSRREKGKAGCGSFISAAPWEEWQDKPQEAHGVPAPVSRDSKVGCRYLHSKVNEQRACGQWMGRVSWARGGTPCLAELQPLPACCSEQKCPPICFFKFSVALSSNGNGADGSPLHGITMALGFPTLPLKCRAEGCPTVHLPSINSSDAGYLLLLFLHLDVALRINHTSVVHNIFKTVTLLQKIYKHKKYQLPLSQDYFRSL